MSQLFLMLISQTCISMHFMYSFQNRLNHQIGISAICWLFPPCFAPLKLRITARHLHCRFFSAGIRGRKASGWKTRSCRWYELHMAVSKHRETPQNGWFIIHNNGKTYENNKQMIFWREKFPPLFFRKHRKMSGCIGDELVKNKSRSIPIHVTDV